MCRGFLSLRPWKAGLPCWPSINRAPRRWPRIASGRRPRGRPWRSARDARAADHVQREGARARRRGIAPGNGEPGRHGTVIQGPTPAPTTPIGGRGDSSATNTSTPQPGGSRVLVREAHDQAEFVPSSPFLKSSANKRLIVTSPITPRWPTASRSPPSCPGRVRRFSPDRPPTCSTRISRGRMARSSTTRPNMVGPPSASPSARGNDPRVRRGGGRHECRGNPPHLDPAVARVRIHGHRCHSRQLDSSSLP